MLGILDLYRSALGKKVLMAATGLVLFGFVLLHMVGNLKVYQGPQKINAYAEGLRQLGAPFLAPGEALWLARIVLLTAVGLHVVAAVQLAGLNRRARPTPYRGGFTPQASTYASRTMRWGGVIIALFVVYHLLHLTHGGAHPDFRPGDVYHNFVTGFRDPMASAVYMLAQLAVGLHLYHGLWSLFQTIGWYGPRVNVLRKRFAALFALVVTGGNLSFPVAVLTGVLRAG